MKVQRDPALCALDAALPGRRAVPPALYGALVAALFWGIVLAARVTGHWEAGVSTADYLRILPDVETIDHR